jgi:hypothetical protein
MTARVLCALGLAMAFALVAACIVHWGYVSHDTLMYLQVGQRLWQGERVYQDLFELNPPLVMWVHMLPAAAAEWTGVRADLIASIATLVAVLLAGGLAAWSVRSRIGLGGAGLGLWGWCTVHALYFDEWGQREQLFVAAYLLYTVARLRPDLTPALRLAIGVLTGVVSCFKPHFLGIVVVVEIFSIATTREWRTLVSVEIGAIIGVGIAYAALLAALPAPASAHLFTELIPMISAGYDRMAADPWLAPGKNAFLFVGPIALVVANSKVQRGRYYPLRIRLIVWACAGLASYALQGKYWVYHQLPVAIPLTLAGLMVLGDVVHRAPADARRRVGRIAIAMVTLYSVAAAGTVLVREPEAPWRAMGADLAPLVSDGEEVMLFSTDVQAYHMLAVAGVRQGRAFLWDYPLVLKGLGDLPQDYVDSIETDLLRGEVVLLNIRQPTYHGIDGDTMPGLLAHLNLETLLHERYERVGTAGILEVWRRNRTGLASGAP